VPSGDWATPGVPPDNPGQRFDSDALLGISAVGRRERAACLARDLAPTLEDIRAGGITSLNRPKHATYRGSRAWSAVQVHRLIAPAGGRTQLKEADRRYGVISGGTGEPRAWVRCPGVLQQTAGRRCRADRDYDHDRVGRPIAWREMASFPQPLHRIILLYRGRALYRVLP